jgi:hypothetical protein
MGKGAATEPMATMLLDILLGQTGHPDATVVMEAMGPRAQMAVMVAKSKRESELMKPIFF